MKTLFRILGTAAAVAVTGAAIVALDKILNQKDPLHVEEVEFPEDAEQNAEEAAKTAEAYAEAEAKASDAANEKAAEEAAPEELMPSVCWSQLLPSPPKKPLPRQHPQRAVRSRCSTRKLPTRTLWKQAPLLLPKTRAENSIPPRSPKPVTLATGKNRAAKDNL
jgi:hypothetical protein